MDTATSNAGAGGGPGAGPRVRPGARLALALALVGAVLVAYARAPGLGFVDLDDVFFVLENPMVDTGLTAEGLRRAFTEVYHAQWMPVTWISYMVDVELGGLAPRVFHVTSLALHAVNVLLLAGLVFRLTRALPAAALSAALLALHPIHVESVAWVSSRKDLLSFGFGIAALLVYTGQRAPARGLWRTPLRALAVLVLFALALASKSMLVTLPCVMLLVDVWPLGRWRGGPAPGAAFADVPRRRAGRERSAAALVLEKLPFLALSAVSGAIVHGAVEDQGIAFPARVANALVSFARYLRKLVWPSDLAAFYPHPAITVRGGWGAPTITASTLVLAALSAIAWRERRRRPWLLLGWLWFLGTLVPVSGLAQISGHAMADRYAYLPFAGIYLVLGLGATELVRAGRGLAVGVAAACALAALGAVTFRQVGTWRDPSTLWAHALEVTEHNFVAHANLGRYYLERGDLEQAREEFAEGLRAKPDVVELLVNLGVTWERTGDMALAYEAFRQAVEVDEDDPEARAILAGACLKTGRDDEAWTHARRALELDARLASAELVLAVLHGRRGEPGAARAAYERAIALEPEDSGARASFGRWLLGVGEHEAARVELERALALEPRLVDARVNLGLALDALGDRAAAARELQSVVDSAPGIPLVHRRLGEIALATGDLDRAALELERALAANGDPLALNRLLAEVNARLGRHAAAAENYRTALEHAPEPELALGLGVALWRAGRHAEAADAYRRSVELDPDFALGHQNLGLILQVMGESREALACHRRALALDPSLSASSDNLAWMLATHPDDALRDGAEAVRIAEALARREGHANPDHLCTLAAAYAEAGRFDEAVRWQERVAALRPGRPKDAERLALYRAGEPYREGVR